MRKPRLVPQTKTPGFSYNSVEGQLQQAQADRVADAQLAEFAIKGAQAALNPPSPEQAAITQLSNELQAIRARLDAAGL